MFERGYDIHIYASQRPPEQDYAPVDEMVSDRIEYTTIPKTKLKRLSHSRPHLSRIIATDPTKLTVLANSFRFGRDALSLHPIYKMSPMIGESFDIIHAHRGTTARIGAILKEAGVCDNLVSTFHGYGVRQAREDPQRYQHLFETGDHFMGVSKHICDELANLGVDKQKISRHFNGIIMSNFSFRWTDTVDSVPDPVKIITVGNLKPIKGHKYGIKALAKLHHNVDVDLEYHIVGGESNRETRDKLGSRKEQLSKQADELNIADKVIFHGHIPRQDVITKLDNSHIYVLTSIEEGLPTVLLEAQAVGLPVVTTDAGGAEDAVSESARIVPPRDVDRLYENLRSLIEIPEQWPEIGKKGRHFVENNFSTDALNDDLVEIYERVAAAE
ncbi:glycosyltransferase [Halohasta litorea]|uniref:Glycosyltransferase n=1 Tax=Halohasta litorea TaxID=869891 RepID=A0ABD6D8N7_9EURY|nr:glycosyltransferase [Halohasta litorea]